MSRPKSLSKPFSTLTEQFVTKLKIINNLKESNFKNPANHLLSYFQQDQSPVSPITQLQTDSIHFNFSQLKQKQFFVSQLTIKKLQVNNKTVVLIINCNIQILVTIKFDIEGFQRKKTYRIQGNKAILLKQYKSGEVKIIVQTQKLNPYASTKINIDTIQTQFQPKKKIIVSKMKKEDIQQYIKLNRGRSAQILKNRAIKIRRSHSSQKLRSGKSFKESDQNFYRPLSTSGCKRELKQINEFQKQKSRYINHMQKMSPQKGIFFQQKHQMYLQKKQEGLRDSLRLVYLAKFAYIIRVKALQLYMRRLQKIKIQMLCRDFCQIMKTKLRYKITQKARYRMTIKQSLVFSSQLFYNIFKPKADNKILNVLMQIQNHKTLLKLTKKSSDYLLKTIIIQRYVRKKRQTKTEAIKCIIKKRSQTLISINKQKHDKILISLNQLSLQYLRKCYQNMESKNLICSLHKNSQTVLKSSLQKLKLM